MRRRFTAFAILCLTMSLPGLVAAQETVKELAAKAGAELRLLNAFQVLERSTFQMNHVLIYANVAERGGWGALDFVETTDYGTNSYVIRNEPVDQKPIVARAHNAVQKSKVATEDEKKGAAIVMENLDLMFALAPKIADLFVAGEFDQASALYHEEGQPVFEAAVRNAQSGVVTVQKRLGKTLLEMRIAK